MVDVFLYGRSGFPRGQSADVAVAMYDALKRPQDAYIGSPVIDAVRRLGVKSSVRSFDFLSIAMAVTAADTFAARENTSDVGWGRELHVSVPLAEPEAFGPVVPTLEKALAFLTGDKWTLELRSGGQLPPKRQTRGHILNLRGVDSVCLFSGGLDSTIGVIDLKVGGRKPVLVSHAYANDQARQEEIQRSIFGELPRFACLANPRWGKQPPGAPKRQSDTTMRGRSFDFLAMAAVAASAVKQVSGMPRVPLFVPENGFIAINPPLTLRRIGSLSTRTTHPHYLGLMQQAFDALDFGIDIDNPYQYSTKGEMIRDCRDKVALGKVAARTVSCGKWKRSHQQCGRCVPCLIRRMSFHSAGIKDPTYPCYRHQLLPDVLKDENQRADLLAFSNGVSWLETPKLASKVRASGPLPSDVTEYSALQAVVERGLREAKSYFTANGISV